MQRSVVLLIASSVWVGACSTPQRPQAQRPIAWIEGCWMAADQLTEESWTRSLAGDQLFGFSVTRSDGQRVFFEQMRIDVNGADIAFHAYPRGAGPTTFAGRQLPGDAIEFRNPDNDYPQKIVYRRDGQTLVGTIALTDGSRENVWSYQRCE